MSMVMAAWMRMSLSSRFLKMLPMPRGCLEDPDFCRLIQGGVSRLRMEQEYREKALQQDMAKE